MVMLRAGEEMYRNLDDVARSGQLGLEAGMVIYAVCRDPGSRNALVEAMTARRLAAGEMDPEAVNEELEELAGEIDHAELRHLLRCHIELWRPDQEPVVLEAVVRHIDERWLQPAGARLLGLWVGGSRPGGTVLTPGRFLASTERPHLTWASAITRMRQTHAPCEYFVSGLMDRGHAADFVREFEARCIAERPSLASRLPLWTAYVLDRVPVRERDEVEFDPAIASPAELPGEQHCLGLHLRGHYDAAEHDVICMSLADVGDEVGARFEGGIRPTADVYRQYR